MASASAAPKRLPKATARIVDAGHDVCFDDRNSVLLAGLLRVDG
jgi:hypothetical protein